MKISSAHEAVMALVACPYCHAAVGAPCFDRGEPPRARKAAHPSRYDLEQRRRQAEVDRQVQEAREEERRRWPDGYPNEWAPMTWGRLVVNDGTIWIFSGVEPTAWPPRMEDARIVERAPHFRWEVGGDGDTYDAGYARSLSFAMRQAEKAFRECWPELVAEYEARVKAARERSSSFDLAF